MNSTTELIQSSNRSAVHSDQASCSCPCTVMHDLDSFYWTAVHCCVHVCSSVLLKAQLSYVLSSILCLVCLSVSDWSDIQVMSKHQRITACRTIALTSVPSGRRGNASTEMWYHWYFVNPGEHLERHKRKRSWTINWVVIWSIICTHLSPIVSLFKTHFISFASIPYTSICLSGFVSVTMIADTLSEGKRRLRKVKVPKLHDLPSILQTFDCKEDRDRYQQLMLAAVSTYQLSLITRLNEKSRNWTAVSFIISFPCGWIRSEYSIHTQVLCSRTSSIGISRCVMSRLIPHSYPSCPMMHATLSVYTNGSNGWGRRIARRD